MYELRLHASSVSPSAVLAAGATGLRENFSGDDYSAIVTAYMTALDATFIVAIAAAGLAFFIALFAKWTSIKGKTVMGAA